MRSDDARRRAGARRAARPAARASQALPSGQVSTRVALGVRVVARRMEAVAAGEVVQAGPGRHLRRRRRRSRRGSSSRGTSAGAASSSPSRVEPGGEGAARRARQRPAVQRARARRHREARARAAAPSTRCGEARGTARACADAGALDRRQQASCQRAVDEQPLLRAVAQVPLVVDRAARRRGARRPSSSSSSLHLVRVRRPAPAGSARRAGSAMPPIAWPRLLPPARVFELEQREVVDAGARAARAPRPGRRCRRRRRRRRRAASRRRRRAAGAAAVAQQVAALGAAPTQPPS